MKTAAIYARYSPGSNQTYQSIEGQLTVIEKFAQDNDIIVLKEHIYIDELLTGKNDNRPAFQRMLKASAGASWDIVLVYAIDRFGRNSIEIALNKNLLQKNGKSVISATQRTSTNIDGSKNLDGILLENMYAGLAEYYSEELSQKVRRGNNESYRKGLFTGGHLLFGYKTVDTDLRTRKSVRKRLEIDEEKAEIVRYLFREYAKGTPKKEIIQALHMKGYKNSKGLPLRISSFQHNLTNRKYIGEFIHEGVMFDNIYPPIIDKETFDKAQRNLVKRKHAPAALKARQEYLLQGKAFCGHCGSRLVGDGGTGKHGGLYYYYSCVKRKKDRDCIKKTESKIPLEKAVVRNTIEFVLEPSRLEEIAERVVALHNNEFDESRIKTLQSTLKKLEGDIVKTINAYIEANAAIRQGLNAKMDELEARKVDTQLTLDSLKAASKLKITKPVFIAWLKDFTKGDIEDVTFCKRIINAIVNAVYVYDDKFVIYYNLNETDPVTYEEAQEDVEEEGDFEEETAVEDSGVRISNSLVRQLITNTNTVKYIYRDKNVFGIICKR